MSKFVTIELTVSEVLLIVDWAASVPNFKPRKEETALFDRLHAFAFQMSPKLLSDRIEALEKIMVEIRGEASSFPANAVVTQPDLEDMIKSMRAVHRLACAALVKEPKPNA